MSKYDPRVTLTQLAGFAREAQELVRGHSLESLLQDPIRTAAFERFMECAGEAVKRLPMDLRDRYPGADWKAIAGMRDWLIHVYDGLDHRILWKAVHERVPDLLETVAQMLSDMDREQANDERQA